MFQAAFRSRKVPFNVHGVAFYRKKVFVPDFLGMGHNLLGKSRLQNLVFPFCTACWDNITVCRS